MEFRYANSETQRDHYAVIEILREKEHYYKNILETLPAAVYTCDAKGYITFYNKAAAELWGREPNIGRDLWCGSWKIYNTNGERMMPDSCPMAIALTEGRAVEDAEIIIERPGGDKRNVQPHPQPIYDSDGNLAGALNMLVDITEIRRTQTALKSTEEQKKDLAQNKHRLEKINDELEQFAYITSHDLKEPVRKIQMFSERLKESSGMLDDHSKRYIEKIMATTDRMNRLIDAVLNYSHVVHQPPHFELTDLNTILKIVLEDLELRIEQAKANICSTELPEAEVIPMQISQLFYNVIVNALKFTDPERAPEIQISSRRLASDENIRYGLSEDKKYFEMMIRDNGIGLGTSSTEDIFRAFHRLHSTRKIEGSGIGLAICRKIATIHQGIIFAESVPGEGTSIHVVLPSRQ